MEYIRTWAERNNLRLNTSKSPEMLIPRGDGHWRVEPPPPLDLERVGSMVILGVTIRDDLRTTSHVDEVLAACSGSLHALRVLRARGLPPTALQEVARATTITRLLYAAPAWWGFASAEDRHRIERFMKKMQRFGYLSPTTKGIEEMIGEAEKRLMQAVIWNECHVLRNSFPAVQQRHYNFRHRSHDFKLPPKDDKNYISRILYRKQYLTAHSIG